MPWQRRCEHERTTGRKRTDTQRTAPLGARQQRTDRHVHPGERRAGGRYRPGPGRRGGGFSGPFRGGRGPPLHPPVAVELQRGQRPLSARLLHHEVQPAHQRAPGRHPGPGRGPPHACRRTRPGRVAPALRAAGHARQDHRSGRGQPAARGRGPRRTHRHAHLPRLPPPPGQPAAQDPHPGHGPRHQPGLGRALRLPRRGGALGRTRHARPGHGGRAHGRGHRRHHGHQPEHAGPFRGAHPRGGGRGPRPRRAGLRRRRQHERGTRGDGCQALRYRRAPPQPAQDLRHPARRRRPGGRPGVRHP